MVYTTLWVAGWSALQAFLEQQWFPPVPELFWKNAWFQEVLITKLIKRFGGVEGRDMGRKDAWLYKLYKFVGHAGPGSYKPCFLS